MKNIKIRLTALLLALLLLFSTASAAGFSFKELKNIDFTFSSGVGGWSTDLAIAEDGSFIGFFHDSEMGESGAGYPNGSVYLCTFGGVFQIGRQLSSTSYEVKLVSFDVETIAGDELGIEDGIRYVGGVPYGLENARDLVLYLPGTPVSDLSQEFVSWCPQLFFAETMPSTLPCYGLYNRTEGYAFIGEEAVY